MRSRLLALLVVSVLLGAPRVVSADANGSSPGSVEALLGRIGSPARRAAVDEALESVRREGGAGPRALATALGQAGGSACLDALAWLIRHGDASTRPLAVASARRVDLRSSALLIALRSVARRGALAATRSEAYEALGHLGDGRDVRILIDGLGAADASERRVAHRALRRLSGANFPPDPDPWEDWWKSTKLKAFPALVKALEALGESPATPGAAVHRATIREYAWVSPFRLETTLDDWLLDANKDLRIEAARLVGEYRLADLAPTVIRSRDSAPNREQRAVMERALARLGVVSE